MAASAPLDPGYLPIEHYGAIGNMRSVALVGLNGSIDWCCFPEIDFPSVFAALLDRRRGGRFRVAPVGARRGRQEYLERTNVLQTTAEVEGGGLSVTDFMPVWGDIRGTGEGRTRPEIHRVLRCSGGEVDVEVEWSPRFDYARAKTEIARTGYGFLATSGVERMALAGVPGGEVVETEGGPLVRARFGLRGGERVALVTYYGSEPADASLEESEAALRETVEAWRGWAGRSSRDWAGPWRDRVVRSELVLKLLTHSDTGAIMAAGTTSLPEVAGGVRNWDYRFSWLRDAAMAVQALMALGHEAEARHFTEWANRVAGDYGGRGRGLQPAFGLHGETEFPDVELGHLEGYRGARPVHAGNGASAQWQHDVYGELLGAARELVRQGGELERDVGTFLASVADGAARHWRSPDYGFWEMAAGPAQFVSSKWMLAQGLSDALELAHGHGLRGDTARWEREMNAVREEVLQRGFDREVGAFVLSYGSKALDASNLLIPMLEFLPADDPRVQGTIDRTLERLTENGLVYRYLVGDGLPGREGTFVACTFWLVSALALSGRVDEAGALFDGVAGRANHLGLYSEEIDATTGAFLGNFPQAFSHIALINSALYLARAQGRGVPSIPRGTGG